MTDLVAGGMEMIVEGDVVASGDVVLWDAHGRLDVRGSLTAQRLVRCEGLPRVGGTVAAPCLNLGGGRTSFPSRSVDDLRTVFSPEAAFDMLDEDGNLSDASGHAGWEIANAYFKGRRIFVAD